LQQLESKRERRVHAQRFLIGANRTAKA